MKNKNEIRIKAEIEGEKIKMLVMFAADFDLEFLKESLEILERDQSAYEAIGIMDGNQYFPKLKDKTARIERLEALINFVEVSQKTENDILRTN